MKTNYFFTVILGMCGDGAETISIVKAFSKKHLASLGFKENSNIDVARHNSIEEAEAFCKKYCKTYPKQRIGYWV